MAIICTFELPPPGFQPAAILIRRFFILLFGEYAARWSKPRRGQHTYDGRNRSFKKEAGIIVYPLPARDELTVRLKNSALLNTEIQLLSSEGRLVQKIKLHSPVQHMHIGYLPAGVYYLKTENGNVFKLIK